jgi:uncharacterized coiled-coil protein SlyX
MAYIQCHGFYFYQSLNQFIMKCFYISKLSITELNFQIKECEEEIQKYSKVVEKLTEKLNQLKKEWKIKVKKQAEKLETND